MTISEVLSGLYHIFLIAQDLIKIKNKLVLEPSRTCRKLWIFNFIWEASKLQT